MSILTPPGTMNPAPPTPQVYRLSVDEYHQMIQAGILTENNPVELLEGILVPRMPRNPPHDIAVELADESIRSRLPTGWRIRIQCAITTGDSEPEPDVAVVRGTARQRSDHHPGPKEIGLLIEVSDSTLSYDRNDKGCAYARAGIACYWIINLVDSQVEVYTNPTGPQTQPAYRQHRVYGKTELVPLILDGQEVAQIPVTDLLS